MIFDLLTLALIAGIRTAGALVNAAAAVYVALRKETP